MKHHMSFTPVGVRNLIKVDKNIFFVAHIQTDKGAQTCSLICLAAALVASKLALRAKRRGIRFGFEPKPSGSSLTSGTAKKARTKCEYPCANPVFSGGETPPLQVFSLHPPKKMI